MSIGLIAQLPRQKHVGTAALGCPGEQRSPTSCSGRTAELRSAGQPRAAVPTWSQTNNDQLEMRAATPYRTNAHSSALLASVTEVQARRALPLYPHSRGGANCSREEQ